MEISKFKIHLRDISFKKKRYVCHRTYLNRMLIDIAFNYVPLWLKTYVK